jgi:DNA repair protein RadC
MVSPITGRRLDLELTVPTAARRAAYVPIFRCSLVRDGRQQVDEKVIRSPADVAPILIDYLAGTDREMMVVVLVDARNKVIGLNTVSVGTLTESLVHPREVFKPAILANAAAVILGHNHPSGDPEPSPQDIATTRRLMEAGKALGIDVLDHVIIGDGTGRWYSLKQSGMM